MSLTTEERALVELRLLRGLTDGRLRQLLERHGSGTAVLALTAELGEESVADARSARHQRRLARALAAAEALDVRVIGRGGPDYPPRLEELPDPPAVLFARGKLELLGRPALAVVGARRATEYGLGTAAALAADLARAGVVVVSGMARGIDAAAHEAALEAGTVGVLGAGIDVVYPPENRHLHERVARDGLLLSEFPPGDPPLPHNFPRRNRIIAALARGVLVVEASVRSGALITVGHVLDLGGEVFAVPGPIGRPTSEGSNALLRDGATFVTCAADILTELGLEPAPILADATAATPAPLPAGGRTVWTALGPDPRHVNALAAASGLTPAAALAGLLELEVAGLVRQLPGLRFRRT